MVRLFRSYSPFTVLILFIAAFIMKLQALSDPQLPQVLPDHIVFAAILKVVNSVLQQNAFAYTLLAVLILFTQALYLNFIAVKYKLFVKNTYLPACSYLLLTSVFPAFNYFSEPLLINWLVLIALNTLLSFSQTTQPRKQIFNAGFLICLPALIQFPSIAFIILLFLALVLLRTFNFGEWMVGIMGYVTPIYFFVGILFLVDLLPALVHFPEIGFSFSVNFSRPVYLSGTLVGLMTLFIIGSYSLQQQLIKHTIYIRRSWGIIYMYLLVSLIVAMIAVSAVNAEWMIALPALSFVISNAFQLEKSRMFSNFTFYFFLLLVIFCQLALNK